MDMDVQWEIKKIVKEYGKDKLIVILGCPDAESAEIHAETVTGGDPFFAGPLAGVSLRLPVYHILETEIKTQIPENVYADQVLELEQFLDVEAISQRMREIRARYL